MSAPTDTRSKAYSRPTAELVFRAIEEADSCVVLLDTSLSKQLGLGDALDDPAIQAAANNASCLAAEPTNVYNALSTFCGSLTRAPKPKLQEVLKHLALSGKLARVYTNDANMPLLLTRQSGKVAGSDDQLTKIESRIVAVRGCIDKFMCAKCSAKSQLTQAVLFKAMCGQQVACEVCGDRGMLAKQMGEAQNGLVPDVFRTVANAQVAIELAQADASAGVHLLVILGSAKGDSDAWSTVVSALDNSSQNTISVGSDIESFVQEWALECAATGGVQSPGLISRVADMTLVASSSDPEESSNGPLHNQRNNGNLVLGVDNATSSDKNGNGRGPKGSKGRNRDRTNLTHLLNFSLPARLPLPLQPMRPRRRAAADPGVGGERQAQINKTIFMNANFRFVLKPRFWTNFMPITVRPDMQLRWEWIERVIMPVTDETVTCPICLSPPVASRVTKCGHIFCYSCVLRYLSYATEDEHDAKKCPICWAAITYDDLLPVHFWSAQYRTNGGDNSALRHVSHSAAKLATGAHITMRLMKRLRGTTVCLPRSTSAQVYSSELVENHHAANKDDGKCGAFESYNFPWTFTEGALPFAKFMLAGHTYCKDEYEHELSELAREKNDESNDSNTRLFIESAIMSVESALKCAVMPVASDQKLEERAVKEQMTQQHLASNTDIDDANEDDFLYFYQADDGQHIYMHPLHMRVLIHQYEDYTALPESLQVKMRHSIESTITDEVRQRFKFLDHLSLRCDVVFVEPELKSIVSRESINKFKAQLTHREKQHAARARHVAIDEARSEFLAAAAAAQAENPGIRYQEEWSRSGQNRFANGAGTPVTHNQGTPNENSFPALVENDADAAIGSVVASASQPKPLWPRQPISHTAFGTSGSPMNDYFWEELDRAAASRHDDCEDEFEHDAHDDDLDDFYVLAKDTGSQSGRQKAVAVQPKKGKKVMTLTLTGGSSRRRR
ncbi:hypothetical protein LPJ66_006008 [Kickxella alabastrina]|uniref:Uncharacterized protein n=1 Tax=Kickxella alabastrina TaxID=61397 RepID=A0ACC1IH87_9FUNG|nr:hypothetical protein LPJ66_006008 [Kickxella alabastrina]